ncbi:unnamed protein product [Caenorhabditis auriculariae]|uniref:Uncharacterized protein n=1 Tax=Caenorhabditis auriculariae TaxID=2777116 RepID=A0A8S1HE74_9PELO|nr:unnamed protein product [Caenorhabditis auriculariae]
MRFIIAAVFVALVTHGIQASAFRSSLQLRQQNLENSMMPSTRDVRDNQDYIGDDLPPQVPRLNKEAKWGLIRAHGMDPLIRRRGLQFQMHHSKSLHKKSKREVKPWRVQNVLPKRPVVPAILKPLVALPVDVCPREFDAVTKAANGRTYFFSRERVFQVYYDDGLPQKASFLIADLFLGGPRQVSAALTNSRSGVTTLFEGRRAYRFRWNRKTKRFHLARNTPQEFPRNITITPATAFEWVDGNQVVSSGDHFMIYDAYWNLATFTDHTRRYFPNLPRDLLGIVYQGGDSTLLMYTKSNKLKVYNATKFKVVLEFPLKINDYVGCLSA